MTGGSDGIGLAIAEALLREGAELCIIGRNPEKLARARDQLGAEVGLAVRTDLATAEGIEEVVQNIAGTGKSLDVLIKQCCHRRRGPVRPCHSGAIRICAIAQPRSTILPDTKIAAAPGSARSIHFQHILVFRQQDDPGTNHERLLTHQGRLEFPDEGACIRAGPRGIRVNAIAPGSVDTPMRRKSVEAMTEERQTELRRYVERSYPLGRIGVPSDLGGIAVFLASQEAAWVTGSIFAIDGGFTAG